MRLQHIPSGVLGNVLGEFSMQLLRYAKSVVCKN